MGARRSSPNQSSQLFIGVAVGVLVGAGVALGLLAGNHGRPLWTTPPDATAVRPPRPSSPPPEPPAPTPPPPPTQPAPVPPRQNPEVSRGPAVGPPPLPRPTLGKQGHPKVAIIFDDAGYSVRSAQEVEAIGRPVTISVLPNLRFSTQIAEDAPAHGVQVILHLPLEPDNPAIWPGPGAVIVAMSEEEIQSTVTMDLATVPTAVGANNHMGSLGTSDPRVMRAVMGTMKARHLFFVDSMTSSHSVAAQVARTMGVPTTTRAVFLDNTDEEDAVRAQCRLLIRLAQARGQAVAIGHVGRVTPRVVMALLPEFDEAGIELVRVSDLVH